MELSKHREKIHHSKKFAFTPVRPKRGCNPGNLFDQSAQLQGQNEENSKPELQNTANHPTSKRQTDFPFQKSLPQGMRNWVEIDAQSAHRLQVRRTGHRTAAKASRWTIRQVWSS